MGEWKAQISLRVRQDLRREIEELAYKKRRKLGNSEKCCSNGPGHSCKLRAALSGF